MDAHLLNHSISERYNLHYWREGNNEIDFILEKGNKVIGLEVKSGAGADNEGMGIFNENFILIRCSWSVQEEFLMSRLFKIGNKKRERMRVRATVRSFAMSGELFGQDSELFLETFGEIGRGIKSCHIAYLADAVRSFRRRNMIIATN